jgi:PiT family inorganic phosphate transporter
VSHKNVVSEVAASGRAVKIKRNPKPKRKVAP